MPRCTLIQRNTVDGTVTAFLPECGTQTHHRDRNPDRQPLLLPRHRSSCPDRNSASQYSYLLSDPQGTAHLNLDHNTQNPVWRDFDPYGDPAEPTPATGPTPTHSSAKRQTRRPASACSAHARTTQQSGDSSLPTPSSKHQTPTSSAVTPTPGTTPLTAPTQLAWRPTTAQPNSAPNRPAAGSGVQTASPAPMRSDTKYRPLSKHIAVSSQNRHYDLYKKYWEDFLKREHKTPKPVSPAEEAAWELAGFATECQSHGPEACQIDTDLLMKIANGVIASHGKDYANWIVVIAGTTRDPYHPYTGTIDPTLYLPLENTPGSDPLSDADNTAVLASDVAAAVVESNAAAAGSRRPRRRASGPVPLHHRSRDARHPRQREDPAIDQGRQPEGRTLRRRPVFLGHRARNQNRRPALTSVRASPLRWSAIHPRRRHRRQRVEPDRRTSECIRGT